MLLRVFLIDLFVGYMMFKELKIGCCFSTDDKDEATDLTYTCQLCVRVLFFQCTYKSDKWHWKAGFQ